MGHRDSHGRFVKDTDNGYAALFERLQAKAQQVSVGIHEEQAEVEYENGITVGEVAEIHELGLGDNQRRSFIADFVDENEEELKGNLRAIAGAVAKGDVASLEQGLDRFGVRTVGEVQLRIKAGIEPEDSDETVERKGSSTPLIDSGLLWTSISHKVSEQE